GADFVGREIEVEIPGDSFFANTNHRVVVARQGINAEVVGHARDQPSELLERLETASAPLLGQSAGITIHRKDNTVTLRNGRLFVATLEIR
ncbi:MAG TPA: hypothetical protein VHL85_05205, partial [Burkholderiales bacterium]|nr:hypothetical protein [Burkholderiales bacterium]